MTRLLARLAAPLSVLVLAPLAGCATVADAPIVDGGPVRLQGTAVHLGEPVAVGKVVVTPETVYEDSRCPVNARCIWAGRVVLTARIDGAGWRETVNLVLGQPMPLRGTSVTLATVEPGRMTAAPIDPADYTFTFDGGD